MAVNKQEKQVLEWIRCPTCGGRITSEDDFCPICGARVFRPAPFRARLSHTLLIALVLLIVLVGTYWFLEPAISLSPTPVATGTHTLWPTPTYTDTPTPTVTNAPTFTPTPTPFCVPHVVGNNENLESIAKTFRVSIEDIRKHNGLGQSVLQAGQEICIPISPEAVFSLTPPPTATPTPITYIVEKGDNLGSIAEKFNTTVEMIVKANNLSEKDILPVGKELIIVQIFPTPTPELPTPTASSTLTVAPTATATPTPTETPSTFEYPPPAPLYPVSGRVFHDQDANIVLSWAAVTLLSSEEWYVVRLYRVETETILLVSSIKTKETSWRVPVSIYPAAGIGSRLFQWDVVVARQTKAGQLIAVSPPSEMRSFFWY